MKIEIENPEILRNHELQKVCFEKGEEIVGQTDNEQTEANQNFEIQVGEPLSCQIDYSMSEQELEGYFDKQMELISAGQENLANIELAMLGYAFDFIDFSKKAANVEINFSEDNVEVFDAILEAVHKLVAAGNMPQERFNDIAKQATAFFGVLILKNLGGDWVQSNVGMAMNIHGTNAFLYNRVTRRIVNGQEDDVISFYEALKNL